MDDQFERRELLLHLGDMLEALNCLARTGQPDAPVVRLATQEALRDFQFLGMVAPEMTASVFSGHVASAFFLWPKGLLEEKLNRKALASTVQHDLFDGNPSGWKAYVAYMRKKVKWYGAGLPEIKSGACEQPAYAAADASPVETSVQTAPLAEWDSPDEKKGWPWPQPGSTS